MQRPTIQEAKPIHRIGRRLEPRVIQDPDIPDDAIARDARNVIQRLRRHATQSFLLGGAGLHLLGGPAPAGLALAAQGFFEIAERFFVPEGLRIRAG